MFSFQLTILQHLAQVFCAFLLDIIGFQCPPIEGMRHCAVPDAKWNLELAKGYHQHVLRNLKTIRLAMDTAAQHEPKFSSCSMSMNSYK